MVMGLFKKGLFNNVIVMMLLTVHPPNRIVEQRNVLSCRKGGWPSMK